MEYSQCRKKFIDTWSQLGVSWGISRTMAQIHALLLLSPVQINAEQIISELDISGGNANTNLRLLLDWGLIYKVQVAGSRCEYFVAEKDTQIIFKRILEQRKKKELDPIQTELQCLLECKCDSVESKEMHKLVLDITQFASKSDKLLNQLIRTDSHWLFNTLFKVLN